MSNTKKNGYAIDHANKTITLTKAYNKRASTPGTKEFRELAMFHKNYSDYTITLRTAVVSDQKETHPGLSVDMIEKIIARQPNSVELQREYNELTAFYGREVNDKNNPGKKVIRAPYGRVKSWFLKRVPDYQNMDFSQSAGNTKNND